MPRLPDRKKKISGKTKKSKVFNQHADNPILKIVDLFAEGQTFRKVGAQSHRLKSLIIRGIREKGCRAGRVLYHARRHSEDKEGGASMFCKKTSKPLLPFLKFPISVLSAYLYHLSILDNDV